MQLKKNLGNKQIKKIQMMAKEITIPYYKAVKQIEMLHESYIQGNPSSQCHHAMALAGFCPELALVDFVPDGRSKLEFLKTM